MFQLNHKAEIIINGIPIQWIPKIELYYPDLPQFPIMYIHTHINNNRLVACPVSVSYEIIQDKCNAKFFVFTNLEPTKEVMDKIKDEIENHIGFSNPINKQTVVDCCKGNSEFINILTDLWQYVEKKLMVQLYLMVAFMRKYFQFNVLLQHGSQKPVGKVK